MTTPITTVTRPDDLQLPQIRYRDVKTLDATRITLTAFEPEETHATVVIHAATATPQRYYRRFAWFLAERGVRVITYDYRGIGRSRRGHVKNLDATITQWADEDARTILWDILDETDPDRLVHIGHSFGGQLVGLLDEMHEAAGALLVGAQFGYWRNWTGLARVKIWAWWNLVLRGLTRVYGYLPGRLAGIGEDLAAGVALEWYRWSRHPDYYMAFHAGVRERLANSRLPVRSYSFTDDVIAPRRAVDHLHDALARGTVEHVRLAPADLGVKQVGHFGFFRPTFQATLWEQALAYILERTAPGRRAPAPVFELRQAA